MQFLERVCGRYVALNQIFFLELKLLELMEEFSVLFAELLKFALMDLYIISQKIRLFIHKFMINRYFLFHFCHIFRRLRPFQITLTTTSSISHIRSSYFGAPPFPTSPVFFILSYLVVLSQYIDMFNFLSGTQSVQFKFIKFISELVQILFHFFYLFRVVSSSSSDINDI